MPGGDRRAGRAYGGSSSSSDYIERAKATRVVASAVTIGPRAPGKPLEWHVLNDTVMGGQSRSTVSVDDTTGALIFAGKAKVSLYFSALTCMTLAYTVACCLSKSHTVILFMINAALCALG